MSIILYHYSDKTLDPLKTREAQGFVTSPEALKEELELKQYTAYPGLYNQQISFFIDPIPRDLPDKFDGRHRFWKSGKTLYEHEVVVNSAISPLALVKFMLVEAPWRQKFMDQTDFNNEHDARNYHLKCAAMRVHLGEQGQGVSDLIKVIEKYKGTCNQHFGQYRDDPYYETDILPKYAAMVPHLMLYPKDGIIPVHQIRRIKLK